MEKQEEARTTKKGEMGMNSKKQEGTLEKTFFEDWDKTIKEMPEKPEPMSARGCFRRGFG